MVVKTIDQLNRLTNDLSIQPMCVKLMKIKPNKISE